MTKWISNYVHLPVNWTELYTHFIKITDSDMKFTAVHLGAVLLWFENWYLSYEPEASERTQEEMDG